MNNETSMLVWLNRTHNWRQTQHDLPIVRLKRRHLHLHKNGGLRT